ncbi:unnamed protein product [Camellia sinensis]
MVDHGFEFKDCNIAPDPPACDIPENYGFEMDDRYSDPGDLDDEDHPWKPLNPYEPGNLRKSFRRRGINSTKQISITIQFPLGRMHGTISSELNDIWEARHHASERQESQSPSKYEKDSRLPFDIQEYGERILEKLSMDADSGNTMSFADVIRGQEKHDIAWTFSALLQMGSGASPNVAAATQFVRAEMLPSGYFIRPCKGGGSIIHKVDMLVWISCQAS